ncbi:MAG TPA: sugar phosphate nucleotidyltransferase [Gemmatimonadaceae bacterium]
MSADVWCVILAGGVGSRFWPVSTAQRPKQLLPLASERPLLRDSLDRMAPLCDPAHTLILTSASLVEPIQRLAPEVPATNLIPEPRPAGTAAALTWAAAQIERASGSDAIMISIHADWAVADAEGFRAALRQAAALARRTQLLVTVGVVPTRPDPGYGYIRPGDVLEASSGARRVAEFAEKPDAERAEVMVREGCLWNSGIFVWRVGDFLAEVRAHCREVAPALDHHGDDLESFFMAVRNPIAVDVGVLERSDRVAVIPGDFGWDDVGTWAALRRVRAADPQGNVASGAVHLVNAANNVVHAEGNEVVLYGVSDLVVVTRDGLTLVTTTEHATDLKQLLSALPASVKDRE